MLPFKKYKIHLRIFKQTAHTFEWLTSHNSVSVCVFDTIHHIRKTHL